jgi:hypothetical protein
MINTQRNDEKGSKFINIEWTYTYIYLINDMKRAIFKELLDFFF